LRTRILTPRERQAIQQYLEADGEKRDLVRVLAQRVRKNRDQLAKDIVLIEKFYKAYMKRNSKGQSHQ
jgi:hypothetical protein